MSAVENIHSQQQAEVSRPRQRMAGLDVIRCLAILMVIAGHFFLHSGFFRTAFVGAQMYLLGMLQTLTMIGVPLFLILTGYLQLNKKLNRGYYRGCIRVLLSYVVISVVTICFRKYYMHEDLSWGQWLLKITDFSAITYGWYIEMWIGLFVLTPFLNSLWHSIGSRRHREVLIVTLYLLTALPDFCNRYGVHLMPGYWESVYPVCFFYIGAYFKAYRPSIRTAWLWTAVVALCALNSTVSILFSNGNEMIQATGGAHGIVCVPLAALVMAACYRTDVQAAWLKGVLAKISVWSLDMYLISALFDMLYYPLLKGSAIYSTDWLVLLFVIVVPLVFASSAAFAAIITPVIAWCTKTKSPLTP